MKAIEEEREREQHQFGDVNKPLQEMDEENKRLKNKRYGSCLAHLSTNPQSPDGIYMIDPDAMFTVKV